MGTADSRADPLAGLAAAAAAGVARPNAPPPATAAEAGGSIRTGGRLNTLLLALELEGTEAAATSARPMVDRGTATEAAAAEAVETTQVGPDSWLRGFGVL